MREMPPRALLALACGAALLLGACSTAGGPGGSRGGLPPALAAVPPGSAGPWLGGSLAKVATGLLRGAPDRGGSLSWKGIPYAQAPVGELRWRAPRPALPWEGIRAATRFGARSPQFAPLTGSFGGSEDCLFLNVWRPDSADQGLPVYVWIHGGGNSMGSSSFVPDYYGDALALRENLVFVSVNYRLGPLGWFAPPGGEALDADSSGNYGSLDLLAALAWIRDNIGAFGGDPSRVTVAGESAGAFNALSLLTSPRATGLFQRLVLQSGGARMRSWADAQAASRELLAVLLRKKGRAPDLASARGLAADMPAEAALAFLRGLSAREILSTRKAGITGMTGWPAVYADGIVFPSDGYACLERGDWPQKVPVILGTNKEETKLFLFLGGGMKTSSELYRAVTAYGSMNWKADAVDGIARKLAAAADQPPVWAYRFDWGSPDAAGRSELPGTWGRSLGAFHTLEIPFFLGTDTINGGFMTGLLFTRRNEAGRKALSALVMDYLGDFAATGNPNGVEASYGWAAWSNGEGGPKTLVLDAREGEASAVMGTEELTRDSIEAEMEASLEPGLLAEVRKRLSGGD